ncbi:MAG: halocyanin domain-containing protein [Halobacteria archaeon]
MKSKMYRRGFVASLAVASAGCMSGGGSNEGDGSTDGNGNTGGDNDGGGGSNDTGGDAGGSKPSYGGYLDSDETFEGVKDETGKDEVSVKVGVKGNQGNNAFSPSAVKVSPGTEVVWKWTGKGAHNVVAENGDFESDLKMDENYTFSHTFDETGVHKYYCRPHKSLGMKGVVEVEN